MKKIWFSFLGIILILSIPNLFGADSESLTLIFLALHVFLVCFILDSSPHRYHLIFVGAFLVRIFFMLWDLYAQSLFILPNSGFDSEMYFYWADKISQDLLLLGEPLRGGVYSKINGLLFYLIGPQRIVGQYLNVLLGLSVIAVVYNTLLLLDIRPKVTQFILLTTAFFPNSLIMSAIFLREIFLTFFVAASLYYFICWFQKNAYIDMALSIAMLGTASVFHSGVIGLLFGYAFAFVFYRSVSDRYNFSMKSGLVFLLLAGCLSFSVTMYKDVFFSKFHDVEITGGIYSVANRRAGEASYLPGLIIKSPVDLVLFGPLKTVFLIASPVPTDWRGLFDVVTFIFDSSLYIFTFLYALFNLRSLYNRKPLCIALFLALIGVLIIFGVGVNNAGTAMRHRQKLIPVFLVFLATTMDTKRKVQESAKVSKTAV